MSQKRTNLTLKNGLRVYVNPKHIGESAVYVGINSGYWQDPFPEVAHTTEHVVGVAARVYGARGALNYADSNAITSAQRTIYYFDDFLPKHLPLAIDNLAKVFSQPDVSVLEREKDAVRHELKPQLHPLLKLAEKNCRALFPNLCSRKLIPLDKRLESLERIKPEDIVDFWNKQYTASNSFVYMAGDIPPSFYDTALKTLEKLPAKDAPSRKETVEPEQPLEKRVEIKEELRDDEVATVQISYRAPHLPECTLKDKAAIELLCAYLGADHGLLYRIMRDDKRFCYSLEVQYSTRVPEASSVSFAVVTQPDLCYEVEKEWVNCLKEVAKIGVSYDILESFKNKAQIIQIHRSRGFDLKGILMEMDDNITHEDVQREIQHLTPEDIAKAAQTFAQRPYVISIALPRKKECSEFSK